MIYATADVDPCIPTNNLSTARKHYGTCTNLCPTTKSTWETICNRRTAYDLQRQGPIPGDRLKKQRQYLCRYGPICLRNPG